MSLDSDAGEWDDYPIIDGQCEHYIIQTDRNREVAVCHCTHPDNPTDREGNCTHTLCPLSPPSEELWRNNEDTPEGKYLVTRRDGTVPEWSWFVLGARDPAAVFALQAYAFRAEELGMDPEYIRDLRALMVEWRNELKVLGPGDPDAVPDREDDPATIEKMATGHSA